MISRWKYRVQSGIETRSLFKTRTGKGEGRVDGGVEGGGRWSTLREGRLVDRSWNRGGLFVPPETKPQRFPVDTQAMQPVQMARLGPPYSQFGTIESVAGAGYTHSTAQTIPVSNEKEVIVTGASGCGQCNSTRLPRLVIDTWLCHPYVSLIVSPRHPSNQARRVRGCPRHP